MSLPPKGLTRREIKDQIKTLSQKELLALTLWPQEFLSTYRGKQLYLLHKYLMQYNASNTFQYNGNLLKSK